VLLWLLSPVLLVCAPASVGRIQTGGPVAPDGTTEVQCDLPVTERLRNIGSKVDKRGMCVMSSVEMSALWANLEELRGLRNWCAGQPGGGYPAKVDRQLTEFCQTRGIPVPEYVQEEGAGLLPLVQQVLASGRIACVTYSGQDGVRYRGPIAHMVCVVHADDRYVAILDNNAIGENDLLWMSPEEFRARFESRSGGWLFYWKAPPPPPIPHNGEREERRNP
jgi:hypothetical protein